MSLILLAKDLPPSTGGIQRYVYQLAQALQRRGEEVVAIGTDHPGAHRLDAASPVPIIRVPAGRGSSTAYAMAEAVEDCLRAGRLASPLRAVIAAF